MPKVITEAMIGDLAYRLLKKAAVVLPPQFVGLLKKAHDRERNQLAQINLRTMLDAVRVAEEENRPLCQDTGLLFYHVIMGGKVRIEGDLNRALIQAAEKATQDIPLRPNAVHPLSRKNWVTILGGGSLTFIMISLQRRTTWRYRLSPKEGEERPKPPLSISPRLVRRLSRCSKASLMPSSMPNPPVLL